MPMFRPKVREVEARQWTGSNSGELCYWLGYAFVAADHTGLLIENRSGRVVARRGDWLVREDDGFYPLEPTVFAATFEQVSA